MSQKIEQMNSPEEKSKYYKTCINVVDGKKCDGKWFQYKAKEDNGYCKACIKIQMKKEKGVKFNKYRH